MALIKKSASSPDFERPVGPQSAVIADIVGPFQMEDKINGGTKPQLIITFQLAETYKDKEGHEKRLMQSEFVTPSTHEKAKLRKWMESLAGRKYKDEEIPETFDTQKLVGKSCILNLIKQDSGYTKVESLTGLPKGTPGIKIESYTRPAWIQDLVDAQEGTTSDAATSEAADDILGVSEPVKPPSKPVTKPAVSKKKAEPVKATVDDAISSTTDVKDDLVDNILSDL